MLSSSDRNKHRARNESQADAWAPWMDDRTTTSYQAQHLGYLQGRRDVTAQWNPALQFEALRVPEELHWQPAADGGQGGGYVLHRIPDAEPLGQHATQAERVARRVAFGHEQPEDPLRPERAHAEGRHDGAVDATRHSHHGAPPAQVAHDRPADLGLDSLALRSGVDAKDVS